MLLLISVWVSGIDDLLLLNLYFMCLNYFVVFSLYGIFVGYERWSLNEVDVWNDYVFNRVKW